MREWREKHGPECEARHDTLYCASDKRKGELCDECHARYKKTHRCDCSKCAADSKTEEKSAKKRKASVLQTKQEQGQTAPRKKPSVPVE
jgi:hypothetical protein